MADRKDTTPDRPFGPDTVEHPHVDVRTGERARPVPANSEGEAKAMPRHDVPAGEGVSGDRHGSTLATPERKQAQRADHAMAPPSGSNHAAVETPKSGRSTKTLIGVVIAVVVILGIFLLLPTDVEAMLPAVAS